MFYLYKWFSQNINVELPSWSIIMIGVKSVIFCSKPYAYSPLIEPLSPVSHVNLHKSKLISNKITLSLVNCPSNLLYGN